jgi:hypothetical protein
MTLASSRHTYPLAAVVRTAQSAGRDIGAPQGLARYEQTHRRATRLLYLKRAVAAPPSLVHQPAPACGPDALACRIPTAGKTPLPFPKNMAWPALYGRNPTASKHKAVDSSGTSHGLSTDLASLAKLFMPARQRESSPTHMDLDNASPCQSKRKSVCPQKTARSTTTAIYK